MPIIRRVPHVEPIHQILTFAALLVLATISLAVDLWLEWPYWDLVIALFIAGVKAVLVLWFFMHMIEQPFRTHLATAVAVLLVLLLIGLTTLDVATRDLVPAAPRPMPHDAFYRR